MTSHGRGRSRLRLLLATAFTATEITLVASTVATADEHDGRHWATAWSVDAGRCGR